MLSRVIIGSTTSIYATLLLVAVITVVGTYWYFLWLEGRQSRYCSDAYLRSVPGFPGLVFALAVAGVLGGGIQNAIIALAVINWPVYQDLPEGLL